MDRLGSGKVGSSTINKNAREKGFSVERDADESDPK